MDTWRTFSRIETAVAIVCFCLTAQRINAQTVNVLDLGAKADGSNTAATTAAFAAAFQMAANVLIKVPPGRYAIDNNNGPFTVTNFSGELQFEGGAKLIFQNSLNGGIWFTGGSGARIRGLRIDYLMAPAVRNSPQEGIKFSGTTDTSLTDAVVDNSPAAGILFYDSIRPRVVNATILHSMADGLHFANCDDARVTGLTTSDTGDDGLAFLNYSQGPDRNGGVATNIVIRNSKARGITTIGTSDVMISNFTIDGTASSGVLCAEDTNYATRVPANVTFSNGSIRNAGKVEPHGGNNFGIEYDGARSCSFVNIEVKSPAGRGVGGRSPNGKIHLENIKVSANISSKIIRG